MLRSVIGAARTGLVAVLSWRAGIRACVLALGMAGACGAATGVQAQRVETPVAREFAIRTDDGNGVVIGVVEPLPGAGGSVRIGFIARCERVSGRLEALLSFGTVPAGKPVQVAAGLPERTVERFGAVVRGGGPAAGFHDPKITAREDVLRFIDAALVAGALVSNGHNSVWNRVGEHENREARTALRGCAERGE